MWISRSNCCVYMNTSQDVKLLIRACVVYVRPIIEHNTVIWDTLLCQRHWNYLSGSAAFYQTYARIWKLCVTRIVAPFSTVQFGSEVFSNWPCMMLQNSILCCGQQWTSYFPSLIAPPPAAIRINCTNHNFLLLPEPTFLRESNKCMVCTSCWCY